MKLHCCIAIILRWALCRAWNGIVSDNEATGGNTQLILPNDVPHTVGNVTFGLPHYWDAVAVRHPDGNAYFTGGFTGSVRATAVTKLNPDTNTSSAAASMNTPRRFHGATVVGNQIIVCGGEIYCSIVQNVLKIVGLTTGGVATSSCEQSNIGVTSWTTITSLPIAVYFLAMVTLLGKAYVIGGMGSETSVRMYDGVSVWVAKAAMSPGRYYHAALALDDDRALVCGGYAPTTVVNTCVIYTASTNTWTNAPNMAQERHHFNLVMSEGMWHRYCKNNDYLQA